MNKRLLNSSSAMRVTKLLTLLTRVGFEPTKTAKLIKKSSIATTLIILFMFIIPPRFICFDFVVRNVVTIKTSNKTGNHGHMAQLLF